MAPARIWSLRIFKYTFVTRIEILHQARLELTIHTEYSGQKFF